MFSSIALTVALVVLASLTNAHMLLTKPPMFPAGDKPDNGPLNPTGASNYPCKQQADGSTYTFDFARTQIPIGSNYSMEFTGSAVHGGGSCQISLTTDLKPTKDSSFKVIHSIEGGCPTRTAIGNLGDNAAMVDPDQYEFTIPSDLAPGDYTFAWTWFNKIGNREMYMNCAPITLTGGSKPSKRDVYRKRQASALDSLPEIFLANIPDVTCHTVDSTDLKFPDPGNSVEQDKTLLTPPTGPVAQCHAPLGAASGGGGGAISTSVAAAAAPSTSTVLVATATPSPIIAATTPATIPTYPSAAVSPSVPISPVAAPVPTSSSAPSTPTGSCPAGSQPCSGTGLTCIGTTQYGLCDLNSCMVPQPLALGTTCNNDAIVRKRSMNRIPYKDRARRWI